MNTISVICDPICTKITTHLENPVLSQSNYRGTSLIRNITPPKKHHRALGIVILYGPRGALFLMGEVLVYERTLGIGLPGET